MHSQKYNSMRFRHVVLIIQFSFVTIDSRLTYLFSQDPECPRKTQNDGLRWIFLPFSAKNGYILALDGVSRMEMSRFEIKPPHI